MRRRQTMPEEWLIITGEVDRARIAAARRLGAGQGVLLVGPIRRNDEQRLRVIARQRGFIVLREQPRVAVRIHNLHELRSALLARTPLLLLSPLYPTRTHPDWRPIARMRAAAFARLAGRRLTALGGMDRKRYARLASLGFIGWAGISSWLNFTRDGQ